VSRDIAEKVVAGTLDSEFDIEIIQGREMTDSEIESVVRILFTMWRIELEKTKSESKL